MDWLYYIEFANLIAVSHLIPLLTQKGSNKVDCGGVTDLVSAKWSAFNGSYPFIPMGYTKFV